MITLVLVDDHAMVRAGVRLLLEREPDMRVIGEASSGIAAIHLAARLQPTVVLLDADVPDMSALLALKHLALAAPHSCVVMVGDAHHDLDIPQAVRAGVMGFLLTQDSAAHLMEAIRATAHGDLMVRWRGRDLGTATCARHDLGAPRHSLLTTREWEVLRLVASGCSNAQIGQQLSISPKTVDSHRTHAMEKLNLHCRADVTRYVLERGWLTDERGAAVAVQSG